MATADPTTLRFITCGSVDDGKSTLIGRLLLDAGCVPTDQLAAATADSQRFGTQGAKIDPALLLDGLAAEREQGITIDVAYRYFGTERRRFIVADTPGHEQYTRNMITGASTADLALVLVDARKGVLTQTKRHSYLAHLLGARTLLLAVNKMDLVGYDRATFDAIVAEHAAFAREIGAADVAAVPISGLTGENVVHRAERMGWYEGPPLLALLEAAPSGHGLAAERSFRMPAQWVNRAGPDFRGIAGLVVAGEVAVGDPVRVLPAGRIATVSRIVTMTGDLDQAVAGQAVTLCLTPDTDCARGDILAAAGDPPSMADAFEATIVWMADAPMLPGRAHWLKLATQTVTATVQAPKYQIDVNTLARLAARTLPLNAIGVATFSTDRPLVFEPYADSRALGGFILIDKETAATVGAGMIHFALRRADNVHWQATTVDRSDRAARMGQVPMVVWLTGLSGAGKSTIANLVERRLASLGRHTFLLDGDNVRHGLNRDLGFADADRVENTRRAGEVARLMTDAGLIVVAAFISPFRADREMVRAMMAPGEFTEVHVDAPLAVAEARDPKGLYAKARSGALSNFTGVDSPYEPPESPELRVDTVTMTAEAAAELIVATLLRRQLDQAPPL